MEYVGALLIGITSSLLATTAFVALSELTRRVLLPWYADRIYRGVRIDGKWQSCRYGNADLYPDEYPMVTLQLTQRADVVSGIAILGKDESEGTCHKLDGQIRDGFFTATAWPVELDAMDAMACLFRIFQAEGALRLKGRMTYLSGSTAEIKVSDKDYEFKKISSYQRHPGYCR